MKKIIFLVITPKTAQMTKSAQKMEGKSPLQQYGRPNFSSK